MVMLKYIVS